MGPEAGQGGGPLSCTEVLGGESPSGQGYNYASQDNRSHKGPGAYCGKNCLLGFGDLHVSSPMGSFESTPTDWEQWNWEDFLGIGIDAYGSNGEPDRGDQIVEGRAGRDHFRRHELPGGPFDWQGSMAERSTDTPGGLRSPQGYETPLQEFYDTCWDSEDLYD